MGSNQIRKTQQTDKTTLVLLEKSKEKLKSISNNSNYNKNIINAGKQLIGNYEKLLITKRTVTLMIPDHIVKKLGTDTVRLTGGVARYKDGRIYEHLKDIRPTKLTKSVKIASLAFFAFDMLEDAIIDEKLKEIEKYVKQIDTKLDAQNYGKYESTIEQFLDLGKYTNDAKRDNRVSIILDKLNDCDRIFNRLYEGKWKEYDTKKTIYHSSRFYNHTEVDKINKLRDELLEYLSIIISCKITEIIGLMQYEKEFVLAQEKSYILQEFCLNQLDRFGKAFGMSALKEFKENYKAPFSRFTTKDGNFKKFAQNCNETLKAIEYTKDTLRCFDLSIPELVSAKKT